MPSIAKGGCAMLDKENAKLLEERVIRRLNLDADDKSVQKAMQRAVLEAIIVTLQEYERLNSDLHHE